MGILLVYDVTDEASFNNIRNWMRNIEQHASDNVNKVWTSLWSKHGVCGCSRAQHSKQACCPGQYCHHCSIARVAGPGDVQQQLSAHCITEHHAVVAGTSGNKQ